MDDGARWLVEITPLAGLGAFGHNCLRLRWRDPATGQRRSLAIDCGARYPDEEFGAEVEHAAFGQLIEPGFAGVLLTHGHEDHIGGLPYLLEAWARAGGSGRCPVYGPPYALSLCRRRLADHSAVEDEAEFRPVVPGATFCIADLSVETLAMEHSTPQSLAYALDTPAGRVVHTGDFKLSGADRNACVSALERWGDHGVELLLSDSTNTLRAGETLAESDVAASLTRHVAASTAAVFVTLFASNLARLDALATIAQRHGRRLCLVGRSLLRHVEVGRELGLITWPADLCVGAARAGDLPRSQVLYALTGSQGEERAGFARAAGGHHPYAHIRAGDTVIFSARIIPGRERSVHGILAEVLRRGASLITPYDDGAVHASGHGQQGEQKALIAALHPEVLVPLHGMRLHLERHAKLAKEAGVARVEVLENGQGLRFASDMWRSFDDADCAVVERRQGRQHVTDSTIVERRRLARRGVAAATISGRASGDPRVALALSGVELTPDDRRDLQHVVRSAASGTSHPEPVRRAIRDWFRAAGRVAPVILVEALS